MKRQPAARSRLVRLAGYGLGVACLWWALQQVSKVGLVEMLKRLDPRWVTLVVVFDVAGYLLQGLRWQLLLRPAGEIRWLRAAQAIYAGLFCNEVTPLRAGEVVRGLLVARWMRRPVLAVAPSIVAERMIDGAWLAGALLVASRLVALPAPVSNALGVLVAVVAACFVVWLIAGRLTHIDGATRLGRALSSLRQSPAMSWSAESLAAWLVSGMVLACQMLAFWCGVKACGLTLTAPACAAVLMVVRLGTLLPAAPANVGTFQFACVMGMGLFSVSGAAAAAVSLVIFVLLTLPLWLIGGVCFAGAGLGWKALRVGAY